MTMTPWSSILSSVQRRLRPARSSSVPDAQLLERFLRQRDEAAFELLMWRHGGMVYGVCRRILQHPQDAEDAFQATFLMLARKAASIGKRESIGGWLYMVAFRIALRSKAQRTRRGRLEKPLEDVPDDDRSIDPVDRASWRELRRLLDAELSRLPEKYRTAFILCHLEGKTCDEAAEHLGCPRGTVQSRISRARERLQARLALRGWRPESPPLTHLLEQYAAPLANVLPVLVHATVHAALLAALGKTLAGLVSPSVVELVNGTVRALYLRKLFFLVLLALLTLLIGSAFAWGMLTLEGQPHSARTGCSASQGP
jgi:RNA polymerase sigma factor (sigma-70 family)